MGLVTGIKEEDIRTFLNRKGIAAEDTFVVARRHNTFLKGLLKLFVSNLYYAMDSTAIRLIAATDDHLIVVKPYGRFTVESLESIDDSHCERIGWRELDSLSIKETPRVARIQWSIHGRKECWTIDKASSGVWRFNASHLEQLKELIARNGGAVV